MNVNSAHEESLLTGVFEEYQRYERYLALALGIAAIPLALLLFRTTSWVGDLTIPAVMAIAFRRYHTAVHRFVGRPGPATDRSLQLWGTFAQACVWGSVPIVAALAVLQLAA